MRFVPIKTDDQLDLQALHRMRDRLITRRTSVINQLRGFLLERGLVFAKSPAKLRERMPEILENAEEGLTPRVRNLLALLWNEWKDLEQQVVDLNHEVELIASSDAACLRLRQIPGIGPLVATAIVASIGNGAAFHKGREFAAWMGLVPNAGKLLAQFECGHIEDHQVGIQIMDRTLDRLAERQRITPDRSLAKPTIQPPRRGSPDRDLTLSLSIALSEAQQVYRVSSAISPRLFYWHTEAQSVTVRISHGKFSTPHV